MYIPEPFAETGPARLHAVIRAHPFGVMTSVVDGVLTATHLPFLIEPGEGPNGTLYAHMARANPHWRAFDGQAEALVVFSGPHGYVSPAWYATAPAVPTWNYVAVHAYGAPVVDDDVQRARAHLARLAAMFEAGRKIRWRLEDQPAAFIDGMVGGVVAFRMEIAHIEGKAKLSQNRSAADRRQVIDALRTDGDAALAEAMTAALDDPR